MSPDVRVILLVEDDSEDAFFFSRAIGRASIGSRLQTVENGLAAIAYLAGQGQYARTGVDSRGLISSFSTLSSPKNPASKSWPESKSIPPRRRSG